MNRSKVARTAGFLLLVFAAAFGGVWAGSKFRQTQTPPGGPPEIPQSRIAAGTSFPAETVVAPEGGEAHDTAELVAGGAVVLFLRSDCPACGVMTERWKALAAAGELAGVPAFGVSMEPAERIAAYRAEKGLPFPVYQDPERRFVEEWEVNAVPLVVVVAPGGEVRDTFYFPDRLDGEQIRRQVGAG